MTLRQVDFDQEKQWWDAKAAREEVDFADARINRELRWRELEKHLSGIKTISDIGGSTGAFAIPLAQRGFDVNLLDISPAVLELARQKAKCAGPERLCIVEGNAADLSIFPDHSFDLNYWGRVSHHYSHRGVRVASDMGRLFRLLFPGDPMPNPVQ